MGQRLGQHFLASEGFITRIASAACPAREPLVIEIGPGKGALTRVLLEHADRLIAIELDGLLADRLPERLEHPAHLEVIHADVLKTDLAQWGPCVIAGNLPYYITSPILHRILTVGPLVKHAVLMMQREVAERILAQPGTSDYGFLSVSVQTQARVEHCFHIPPGAFRPRPQVDSSVLRFTPREPWLANRDAFLQFAMQCFRQKRKTLGNNLNRKDFPEASLRAEQLSVEQLADLWGRLNPPPAILKS